MTQGDLHKQNQESFSRLKTKFDSETVFEVFYVNTMEFLTWNKLLDWSFWTIQKLVLSFVSGLCSDFELIS